ncbi:hypothetical protein QVD17_15209 [Tagetes erecta]|uniref:Uncharacterized protein n=1 Tax=Tagetes erecta TaxID=13708 RepID=A0AAD8KVI9_TARER|nr:hypothetical protein QVD17_15209 [Tagetes erecta]
MHKVVHVTNQRKLWWSRREKVGGFTCVSCDLELLIYSPPLLPASSFTPISSSSSASSFVLNSTSPSPSSFCLCRLGIGF